jgi:hypothetical protein
MTRIFQIDPLVNAMVAQANADIAAYNRSHPARYAVKKGRRWYDCHRWLGRDLRPTYTDLAHRQIMRDLDWAQRIAAECRGRVVDLLAGAHHG